MTGCSETNLKPSPFSPSHLPEAFTRLDEGNDADFYGVDRMINHLDETALRTVEQIIAQLVIEDQPAILDLMCGPDSHLPGHLASSRVVGLGLNPRELAANPVLTEYVIHDLNRNPALPLAEASFDVVLNTVSVDYLIKPVEVFKEVARVLKPGGLFLVIFSNRMFPRKAVKVWREASEEERVILVEEFFESTGLFEKNRTFVSRCLPRPEGDKYAGVSALSDPVYAVYAERAGGEKGRRPRPEVKNELIGQVRRDELAMRMKSIKSTGKCPYCDHPLRKWQVPDGPFGQTWDNDFLYICFNDGCSYYLRGWEVMARRFNRTNSYRLMYNPAKDCCQPIPVPTPNALRESIVE